MCLDVVKATRILSLTFSFTLQKFNIIKSKTPQSILNPLIETPQEQLFGCRENQEKERKILKRKKNVYEKTIKSKLDGDITKIT